MPILATRCDLCGHEGEEIRSVSDHSPLPDHCGQPMRQIPGLIGAIAFATKGGNWVHSTTTGRSTRGNKKPVTIGRGHGLGGRRKPASMASAAAAAAGVKS